MYSHCYHSWTITVDNRFTITNGQLAVDASELGLPPGGFFSTISLKSPKTGDVVVFNATGTDHSGQVFNYVGTTKAGKAVMLHVFND